MGAKGIGTLWHQSSKIKTNRALPAMGVLFVDGVQLVQMQRLVNRLKIIRFFLFFIRR